MEITRKVTFRTDEICVGDQITVRLSGFGKFTATAQKVTGNSVLFLFDDAIATHSMNEANTNGGGFEKSDMNRWLQDTVWLAFPKKLRYRVKNITLPTYGEIFGHDECFHKNFEPDTDERFELMKQRGNRVCDFDNNWCWWWLRNATKKEVSSTSFACVCAYGIAYAYYASYSYGVRPEFWLAR